MKKAGVLLCCLLIEALAFAIGVAYKPALCVAVALHRAKYHLLKKSERTMRAHGFWEESTQAGNGRGKDGKR